MTRKAVFSLSVLLAAGGFAATTWADDEDKPVKQEVKEDFKEAGRAIGGAARKVGHGTKKATKEVGKGVKEAAVTTGHAFRDGAKELKSAVSGEGTTKKTNETPAKQPHKAP